MIEDELRLLDEELRQCDDEFIEELLEEINKKNTMNRKTPLPVVEGVEKNNRFFKQFFQ